MGAIGKTENLDAVGAYIIRKLDGSGINYTVQFDYHEKTRFFTEFLSDSPLSYIVTSARDAISVSLQNWMNDAFLKNITGSFRIEPIQHKWTMIHSGFGSVKRAKHQTNSNNQVQPFGDGGVIDSNSAEEMDSDVAEEYKKINPSNITDKEMQEHARKLKEEYGVVLFNLEKNFGGLNGAGKSTTISMLAGMFGPSSGTAFVHGKDIRYDMDSIHQVMGLTAQFDILYPDLSCEDHLLFYARMKGVKIKHEKEHVQLLLRQVGLDNETLKVRFSPASSSLSGGRLSVAISLIGDPKVILLDEPTTGLDPLSKRHVWSIILAQKKNRTIILTTHSMEEADALCDRMTMAT